MSSALRLLAILDLFDEERSVWTAEEAARALDVSVSTAYRYFRSLGAADLLVPVTGDGYRLGPAILKYDRLIRLTDPLIETARPILSQMQKDAGEHTAVFLSRMFRDSVMCVLAKSGGRAPTDLSFERGRPMPFFRGSASKMLLAYLPRRTLKRLYDNHSEEIHGAMRVSDWRGFLDVLRDLRRAGSCQAQGEVDPGIFGITAPVFDERGNATASLTIAGKADAITVSESERLDELVRSAAQAISAKLAQSGSGKPFSPRIVA